LAQKMRKDVSCVVPLHSEGLIAHKTMRSINRAARCAEQFGLSVEIVFVLDRPTPETKCYVETSPVIHPASKLIWANFGDAGLARNLGVQHADGEYIAIHDGDDLSSENWLLRAHELNRLDRRYVIHPEITIGFDQKNYVVYHPDQRRRNFAGVDIVFENYWPYICFSHRETFLEVPYTATPKSSGFGYEDWHWNCEVVARGFIHTIALGTVFFNRLKETGSRFTEHNTRNTLIPHTALLDKNEKRHILRTGTAR
jgi:glycosyltransferase involved in cell wall biosynthesis